MWWNHFIGIESKSYRRSRSRERSHRSERRDRPRRSSRERSTSKERRYRERSRERSGRYYESGSSYRDGRSRSRDRNASGSAAAGNSGGDHYSERYVVIHNLLYILINTINSKREHFKIIKTDQIVQETSPRIIRAIQVNHQSEGKEVFSWKKICRFLHFPPIDTAFFSL